MALTQADFERAAAIIGCEPEAVQAVAAVESGGKALDPEGFPITLFEGHWFYRLTSGKYAKTHPTICYPKWVRTFYGKTWKEEKARLEAASKLDRTAALQSASWGMFQIMGFNHARCGFKTVQGFVNAMCQGEGAQLDAFAVYIVNAGLADEMQDKRWADFARLYNGPEYKANQYDSKLAAAYAKFKKK